MRLKILSFFLLISAFVSAQDVSGTWFAQVTPNNFYSVPNKIVMELQQTRDSVLSGVIHYYYAENNYEHYQVSGKLDKKNQRVTLTEDQLINYNFPPGTVLFKGGFDLKLSILKERLVMTGWWIPEKPGNPSLEYKMAKALPLIKTEQPADTAKRKTEVLKNDRVDKISKVLEFDKDESSSIEIEIYDNGEIDGDSITVLINDKVVVNNQRITDKAIRIKTELTHESPIAKVKMIAENLGTIPPNSALMIITTKKNSYTVRLQSDLKSNGAIELFLKE